MRIGLSLLLLAVFAPAEGFSEADLRKEFAELKTVVERALGRPPGWSVELRVVESRKNPAGPTSDRADPTRQARESSPAWYEPATRQVCVIGPILCGLKAIQRRTLLLHELIHAYRFSCDQISAYVLSTGDPDRATAEVCAKEGDASFLSELILLGLTERPPGTTLFAWIRQHREVAESIGPGLRKWAEARVDAETLESAPYLSGLLFSFAVYAERGLDGLRSALRDPPTTMEQVLHPEKYLAEVRETPTLFVRPEPPEPIAEGWKRIDQGIRGEFHLRMALQAHLSRERAEQATAGWDGSIYQLYAPAGEGRCLLAMITSWDRETDATEFAEAWQGMARLRDGEKSVGVTVERRGRRVLVLDGTDGLDCAPIRGAFWGAAAVAGKRAR